MQLTAIVLFLLSLVSLAHFSLVLPFDKGMQGKDKEGQPFVELTRIRAIGILASVLSAGIFLWVIYLTRTK